MELRKTIALSTFVHICVLAAITFLPQRFMGGGSSKINDNMVVFVRLVDALSKEETKTQASVIQRPLEDKNIGKVSEHRGTSKVYDLYKRKEEIIQETVYEKTEPEKEVATSDRVIKDITEGTPVDSAVSTVDAVLAEGGPEFRKRAKTSNTEIEDIPEQIPMSDGAADAEEVVLTRGEAEGNSIRTVSEKEGSSDGDRGLSDAYAEGVVSSKTVGPEGEADRSAEAIKIIRGLIERAKTYPVSARRRSIEGTVYVSFRIQSNGMPEDIRITKSSGSRILDRGAIKIIRKAGPFPYIESIINVPISFRLKYQ